MIFYFLLFTFYLPYQLNPSCSCRLQNFIIFEKSAVIFREFRLFLLRLNSYPTENKVLIFWVSGKYWGPKQTFFLVLLPGGYHTAFKEPEPGESKGSSPVLRGRRRGNPPELPGKTDTKPNTINIVSIFGNFYYLRDDKQDSIE